MIEKNDVIFLFPITICYFMAQNLPDKLKVRVVTNSIIIAEELRDRENVSVILLGGEMDKKGNCYDAIAIDTIKKLRVDKCFISSVMDSSKRRIGMFPKEKIGFDSIVSISPAERLDMLITDWDVLDEELNLFREKGIEVIVVDKE